MKFKYLAAVASVAFVATGVAYARESAIGPFPAITPEILGIADGGLSAVSLVRPTEVKD